MKLRIRDLREDKDFTQKQIAEFLMCDQSLYSKYERGERSNAALAGISKTVQSQSRRKLRKATESQAERQRIIGAEANRIAALTRQRRAQAFAFRRHKGCSSLRLPIETFLLGDLKGGILFRERE